MNPTAPMLPSVTIEAVWSYLCFVAWYYLIPHVAGTLALYAYAYRDYVREGALEAALDRSKIDTAARHSVWKSMKHEHALPLHSYDEAGGVAGAYRSILPQVLWVDWCVAPCLALLWGWLPLTLPGLTDMWDSSNMLLSVLLMLARVAVCAVVYEVILVGAHVIMHRPAIYPLVHKTHHMGPQCALAGTYMTGWEAAINGTGLSFAIIGLLGLPMYVSLFTAVMGRINLGRVHSGWRDIDTTTPEAAFHGVHHLAMGNSASNFGFAEWFDKLLGSHVDPRTVFPESFPAINGAVPLPSKDLKVADGIRSATKKLKKVA